MSTAINYHGKEAQSRRHAPGAARRRAQGDRARPLRRRLHPAGHAVGQDPALAARACAHPLDRHLEGAGAARRQGGDHRAPTCPSRSSSIVGPERVAVNFWHMTRNIMAREKVLYEGHAVAAVAAISEAIADEALRADRSRLRGAAARDRRRRGDAARCAAAVRGHDHARRRAARRPSPRTSPSASSSSSATSTAGFAAADEIVEMSFKTAPVHQGYIEPQACLARFDADGQARDLGVEPGPLRGARAHRAAARHEDRRPARASGRDRRRLRRQDRRLRRAGGGRAVAQDPATR